VADTVWPVTCLITHPDTTVMELYAPS
jgi:hypothetical protein